MTQLKHQIAGLDGVWFTTPISVNESLEKQQYTLASYQTAHANGDAPYPPQSAWAPSTWVTDSSGTNCGLPFYLRSSNLALYSASSSYNASGTTAVFNETQKLWVGSRDAFQGHLCTARYCHALHRSRNVDRLHESNHQASDCNQGNVIN